MFKIKCTNSDYNVFISHYNSVSWLRGNYNEYVYVLSIQFEGSCPDRKCLKTNIIHSY